MTIHKTYQVATSLKPGDVYYSTATCLSAAAEIDLENFLYHHAPRGVDNTAMAQDFLNQWVEESSYDKDELKLTIQTMTHESDDE